MLRKGLVTLQEQLIGGGEVQPVLIDRLRRAWSNDAWSARTEFLLAMLRLLPTTTGTVVECGSGLSTLALAAATSTSRRRIVSLENDQAWAARVREGLTHLSAPHVEVVLSPIRSYGEFDWYSLPNPGAIGPVGFVVCDGPPGSTRGGRYGAGSVLNDTLVPGSLLLLDDSARQAEREIIARWRRELSAELLEESATFCVIRVGAR